MAPLGVSFSKRKQPNPLLKIVKMESKLLKSLMDFVYAMPWQLSFMPQKVLESPSLKILKNHLNTVLCHVLWGDLA